MKKLLVITAVLLSSVAVAQKNISINQHINDDGKKLFIKVKGTVNGKEVNYNRTFDVSALTKEERDALKERVYDTLGLPSPVAPVPPLAPSAPLAPAAPLPPQPAIELVAPVEFNTAISITTANGQYTESYVVGGEHPYTKEIKYNPLAGILYMKYRFNKKGEEVTYEKSVEAKDKSKKERDDIIKKYEKEIGLTETQAI